MLKEKMGRHTRPPKDKPGRFLHTAILKGIAVFFCSTRNPLNPLSPPCYISNSTKSASVKKRMRFFHVGNRRFLPHCRIRAPPFQSEFLKKFRLEVTEVYAPRKELILEDCGYTELTYKQFSCQEIGSFHVDKQFTGTGLNVQRYTAFISAFPFLCFPPVERARR